MIILTGPILTEHFIYIYLQDWKGTFQNKLHSQHLFKQPKYSQVLPGKSLTTKLLINVCVEDLMVN